jgi:PAS domain S-box-containing protein
MIENKNSQGDKNENTSLSFSQHNVDGASPGYMKDKRYGTRHALRLFIFITIILIILAGLISLLILHFFPNLSLVAEILIDLLLLIGVIVPLFLIFAYQPLLRYYRQEKETQAFLEQTNEKIQQLEFELEQSPTISYSCVFIDGFPIETISKNVNHFGYSAKKLVTDGAALSTLVHPDDFNRVTGEISEGIAAGLDDFKQDYRILTKEGDVRWVISYNWINRNQKGAILNLQGIMLDITHRVKTKQNFQQAEQLVESIFTMTHVLKAHLDHDFNFLRVNSAFSEIVGEPLDFFPGKNFFDIFPDIDLKSQFKKVVKDNETVVIHDQKMPGSAYKDIPNRYWDWVVQPIRNFQNDEKGIMLSMIDVTDHALARKEIEVERNKLVQILNTMQDGVYIINDKHEIEYVNPVIEQEFGYLTNQKCYEYFHGANEPCSHCRLPLIKRRKVANYEQEIPSTGKIYDVLDIPLDNPDGTLSKLKVMHDITKLKANEEQLQLLSHHQTKILEDERQYIARELHDEAGQAIMGLMLDLQLIETQVDNKDYVLEKVKEINQTLVNVSENLHNIAMTLRPASLDHLGLVSAINQYVDAIKGLSQVKIDVKNDGIDKRLPHNIETMIYRIVQEAITNVIRHAQATHAEVVLQLSDNKLNVSIEDNGIGFDPNVPPTPSHIGLLGMRERVQIVNGKLKIESAHNQGTKILVEVDCDNPDSGC